MYPTIRIGFHNLITRKVSLWVLIGEVINTLDHKK